MAKIRNCEECGQAVDISNPKGRAWQTHVMNHRMNDTVRCTACGKEGGRRNFTSHHKKCPSGGNSLTLVKINERAYQSTAQQRRDAVNTIADALMKPSVAERLLIVSQSLSELTNTILEIAAEVEGDTTRSDLKVRLEDLIKSL